MPKIEVTELGDKAADVVKRVLATGESIEIEEDGVVVARVIPDLNIEAVDESDIGAFWAELDEVSAEISASWPKGVTAQDAVNDVRREL